MEEVLLSKEGFIELEKELEHLKLVKRPEIVERIKFARELGDLSENAEYDSAKNEQAQIEGKIFEIEDTLKRAKILDSHDKKAGIVTVGSTVVILDKSDNVEYTYSIVGTTEADIFENKVSNESPIGSSLLGKKVGAVVMVRTPNNKNYEVEIKKIK